MPCLIVHDRAKTDLDNIADYIADDSIDAALRFYQAAGKPSTDSPISRARALSIPRAIPPMPASESGPSPAFATS